MSSFSSEDSRLSVRPSAKGIAKSNPNACFIISFSDAYQSELSSSFLLDDVVVSFLSVLTDGTEGVVGLEAESPQDVKKKVVDNRTKASNLNFDCIDNFSRIYNFKMFVRNKK